MIKDDAFCSPIQLHAFVDIFGVHKRVTFLATTLKFLIGKDWKIFKKMQKKIIMKIHRLQFF